MYRKLLITGAACAALALAACGKKAEDTDMAAQGTPDANPTATVPTPANEAGAPDFVAKAAASDMFEIESSKLALTRTKNADIKAFAQMMIDMHTQTTAGLKKAIADSGQPLTPPAALPADLQSKLDDLSKASDADFDKAYMDAQVDGHQAALDLMTRYASDGDVPALKDAAAKTAPIVQEHLTKATALRDGLKS
jgi:putative membrane protein